MSMRRFISLLAVVCLLLPGIAWAETEWYEVVNQTFDGAIPSSYVVENNAEGNTVRTSGGKLELVTAAGNAQPTVTVPSPVESGVSVIRFETEKDSGTERAQDVLSVLGSNNACAVKFRWFGTSLQAYTADTVNAGGTKDYQELTAAQPAKIEVRLDLARQKVTISIQGEDTPILSEHSFFSSACEDISTIRLGGATRIFGTKTHGTVWFGGVSVHSEQPAATPRHIMASHDFSEASVPDGFTHGNDTEIASGTVKTGSFLEWSAPAPLFGVINIETRVRVFNTGGIEVYAGGSGESMFLLNFKEDSVLEHRVDSGNKKRVRYIKRQWYCLRIRVDMLNNTLSVWLDGTCIGETWPFQYEKAFDNLARVRFTSDLQGMEIDSLNVYRDSAEAVWSDSAALSGIIPEETIQDIALPTHGSYQSAIEWTSGSPEFIEITSAIPPERPATYKTAEVKRPEQDTPVTLTATITEGAYSRQIQFTTVVKHAFTDQETADWVAQSLEIPYSGEVINNLFLTKTGGFGTQIRWTSDAPGVVAENGLVHQPEHTQAQVILTATVTKNGAEAKKIIPVTVLPKYMEIKDPNVITDEAFFGVWNGSGWSVEPKLNYMYNAALGEVGACVQNGDYTAAKQQLSEYWKQKDMEAQPATEKNASLVELTIDQIWNYSQREKYITTFAVDNDTKEHTVDITASFRANKTATYLLMSRTKGLETTTFSSREGIAPPRLEVVVNGNTLTLPAKSDTYVRARDFSKTCYGSEETLLVRDSGEPVDSGNMRGYLKFDVTGIKNTDTITSAKIKLTGATDATAGTQNIMLFQAGLQIWSENSLTWDDIGHMTYSYNGLAGGFDYRQQPDQDEQWLAWTSRDYWVQPMIYQYEQTKDEWYAYQTLRLAVNQSKYGYGSPVDIIRKLSKSPSMTGGALTALLKQVWNKGDQLYRLEGNRIDNLGVKSADIPLWFPEFVDSESWWNEVTYNTNNLLNDTNGLLYEDGSYLEGSNHYVVHVLNGLFSVKKAYEKANRPALEVLDRKFPQLMRYFMDISGPNGQVSEWGDTTTSGGHMSRASLLQYAQEFGEDDILYYASGGSSGTKPAYTSTHYPVGKIGIMRSGWDSDALFAFINNRTGGFHSHPDANHLSVYAYGRRLLTDAGLVSYDDSNPVANWERNTTVAHNTVEVNGTAQVTSQSNVLADQPYSETEMTVNPAFDVFTGYHEANRDGSQVFGHKRTVFFFKEGFWIVSDQMTPPENSAVNSYNQTWHAHPDADISLNGATKAAKTNYAAGANIFVVPLDTEQIEASVPAGYGYGVEGPYISYRQRAAGEVQFHTLLYPVREGDESIPKLTALDAVSGTGMKIEFGGGKAPGFYFQSDKAEPAPGQFGAYETNAQTAYAADGNTAYLLVNGSSLSDGEQQLIACDTRLEHLSVRIKQGTMEVCGQAAAGLRLYAPEQLSSVTVNGFSVPFVQSGNLVIPDIGYPAFSEPEWTVQHGEAGVKVTASDLSGMGGSAVLVLAAYSTEGVLHSAAIVPVSLEAGQTETFEPRLTCLPETVRDIRLYYWKDALGISPLQKEIHWPGKQGF